MEVCETINNFLVTKIDGLGYPMPCYATHSFFCQHRTFTAAPLLNLLVLEDILANGTTPVAHSPAVIALCKQEYLVPGRRQRGLWQKALKPT